MLARANINAEIKALELQRIEAQFVIDKRNIESDTRDDADTIANKITIQTAQKAINIRNKNKEIADTARNITALSAAISELA